MDNIYTISNQYLEVKISTKAAEVHSFKSKDDDYNYAWSGETKYWKGRNPILFPQVSITDNKTVLINGTFYPMGNHGFARDSIFNVEDIKDNEITLSIKENEETLKQYPFKFKLSVNYKLQDKKMIITYKINNNSNDKMPFGFGLHPAFNCPLDYNNTKVVFDKEEDGLGKELIISKELFEKYPTVVINNPNSISSTLLSNNKKIRISYKGFKILAFWSAGPFVCVEPWMNKTEPDHNIEMSKREGIEILNPNSEFIAQYSWEII